MPIPLVAPLVTPDPLSRFGPLTPLIPFNSPLPGLVAPLADVAPLIGLVPMTLCPLKVGSSPVDSMASSRLDILSNSRRKYFNWKIHNFFIL